MSLFKSIKCFLGLHEPMKRVRVIFYGKEFQKCRNCGRLLEPKENEHERN